MDVVDITKQLEVKRKLDSSNENLMLIADLIKSGEIKEVIGVIKYNEKYFAIFENIPEVKQDNLNAKELKNLIVKYIDKVPTQN